MSAFSFNPSEIPWLSLEQPDSDRDGVLHFFMSTLAEIDPFIFTAKNNVYTEYDEQEMGVMWLDARHAHIIGDGVDRIEIGSHGWAGDQLIRKQWTRDPYDTLELWPGDPQGSGPPPVQPGGEIYEIEGEDDEIESTLNLNDYF